MNTENIYQKMKIDDLKKLAQSKNISCKETKETLIESLLLYDKGKYVYPTTHEKVKNGFIVGISLNNDGDLCQIGKLIEKGEAKNLNIFSDDRVHFFSSTKLI